MSSEWISIYLLPEAAHVAQAECQFVDAEQKLSLQWLHSCDCFDCANLAPGGTCGTLPLPLPMSTFLSPFLSPCLSPCLSPMDNRLIEGRDKLRNDERQKTMHKLYH